jgi:hypothetical protein
MNNRALQGRLSPTSSADFRQAFQRPRTALGATGHWIKTLGILAPLVIGEVIKDPEQKWRAVRISAVATALLSEALWTQRVRRDREEQRQR